MLGPLRYLYIGTDGFERDLAYYRDVVGGRLVWNLEGFGARVAAFDVGGGPLILIADHRPAPSCMPVFMVERLESAVAELKGRGWKEEAGPFEIPNGPCYTFKDPSGNPFAIFQDDRPNALDAESEGPRTPKRAAGGRPTRR